MKIYYNKEGWVCERGPFLYPIENNESYIEVSETDYWKTMAHYDHYAWKVVNGQLKYEQYEDIPTNEIQEELRKKREEICFPIVNRGKVWYNLLNEEQLKELETWYNDWLNVTETLKEPILPLWIK